MRLTRWQRLAWNSWPFCLCFANVGCTSIYHHTQPTGIIWTVVSHNLLGKWPFSFSGSLKIQRSLADEERRLRELSPMASNNISFCKLWSNIEFYLPLKLLWGLEWTPRWHFPPFFFNFEDSFELEVVTQLIPLPIRLHMPVSWTLNGKCFLTSWFGL